jgi:threonine dehydrogenase-like Zn-dependent dehydrogenase
LECGDRREVGVLKTDGALASYVRVPGSRVHVLPKELSLQKAALTEPLAVVVRALKTAGLWEPLTAQPQVLLTGVGSLGLLAIKALMSRGFTKIHAIERSERKLSLLPSPITSSESLKAEDIQNADVVIDFSGSGQVLKQILGAIRAQSRLVLIGFPYEDAMLSPEKLVEKEVQVRGSLGSDSQDFKDALSLLPRLDVDVYLEQVYPIQAFAEAIDVSRNPELLKVMIAVHPNATDGLGGRAR